MALAVYAQLMTSDMVFVLMHTDMLSMSAVEFVGPDVNDTSKNEPWM